MQILPIPSKRRSLKSVLAALVASAGLSLAPVTSAAAVIAPAPAPVAAPPPDDIGAPPSDPDQNDAPVTATSRQPGDSKTETLCNDGVDNDGDTVYDCGDDDCAGASACQADGRPEFTEERCHDWLDNDRDGAFDCDDSDCADMDVCKGSWDKAAAGSGARSTGTDGFDHRADPEDLLGKGQDADGERSEHMCSDGYDNDHDGKTDCEDLGCRLDTSVVNCQPATNFRFSVVARTQGTYDVQEKQANVEFSAIQLRVLGQIPYIQNSFFLLSFRAEKTPRMVFAMFQVPIKGGHYFNINSGAGGLSLELVRSIHKRLLVDPAFYMLNAFEQGNGAALEFGGPLDKRGKFLYRTFLAGGSGRFAGNIGGTFFPDNNQNFTYSAGAQLWMNLVGYYNRFDSPLLYTTAPTALAIAVGAKYDQRAQERYPAANIQATFRYRRLILLAEAYGKRELNFGSSQIAYNIQLGVLPIKKRLLLTGDFGQYLASPFEKPPAELGYDLRRQNQEMQYRAAAHVFLWRELFMLTLLWSDRRVRTSALSTAAAVVTKQQDLRLVFQYRF
ncbi:MAG: hypothetical protein H0T76_16815 [Nannocystis sp.]|nr:hypothetical protein [Nannocystis sp.]MBA3548146.1 hypothetical protein [Nannocystis sp.]